MKKAFTIALSLFLLPGLTACHTSEVQNTEVIIFAAASMQESLDAVIEQYEDAVSGVTILPAYDSSGTLKTQIQEGAPCDLFLSASPRQMDELAEEGLLAEETRVDLLENKVVLAVPAGNPAGIETFDQLADLLKNGEVLLAAGNSDVPVGQYTQKIFAYYGIDEAAIGSSLTYGSNAKEVTTQVSEGTVDCGIVYATDAFSAGLTVVDSAAAEMCGQVIYPVAAIRDSAQPEAAQAFLSYLSSADAKACFEDVGFSPVID